MNPEAVKVPGGTGDDRGYRGARLVSGGRAVRAGTSGGGSIRRTVYAEYGRRAEGDTRRFIGRIALDADAHGAAVHAGRLPHAVSTNTSNSGRCSLN